MNLINMVCQKSSLNEMGENTFGNVVAKMTWFSNVTFRFINQMKGSLYL